MDTHGAGLAVGGVGVAAYTAMRAERQREAGKGEDAGPRGLQEGRGGIPGATLGGGHQDTGWGRPTGGGPLEATSLLV